MRLREHFPYSELVKYTPGYVGADIQTLCKEASIMAVERAIRATDELKTNKKQKETAEGADEGEGEND